MKTFTLFLAIILSGFVLKAQVLNENFDASTNLPTDWHKIVRTNSSYYDISVYGYKGNSAPNSVKLYSSTATDTLMLITPQVDFTTASNYKVSFYMYGSSGNQIAIGTMTDPSDVNTYQAIDTVAISEGYKFIKLESFIAPNELSHLVLKRITGSTIYIDDVVVEEVLPYNVAIDVITNNETILTESNFKYKVLVKNTGTNNAKMNLSVISDLDYKIFDKKEQNEIALLELNGLSSDTIIVDITSSAISEGTKEETFSIKASVDESPTINDEVLINFTTYIPFIEIEEGFDDGESPFAWSVAGEESKVKFYLNSYNTYSGKGYVQFSASTDSTMLITPALKGYSGDYKASAWVKGNTELEVGFITDLNDWTTYTKAGTMIGDEYSYELNEVLLSDFNTNAYIVFKYKGSGYSTLKLDELDIERSEDYSVDIKTDYTDAAGYANNEIYYPVYLFNKGLLNETYNILVDCSWSYKILKTDSITEVTSLDITLGEKDTVYIKVTIPNKGFLNGEENIAKVKVECNNNKSNYEEVDFKTKAFLYLSYLNERFEDINEFPTNWNTYGAPGTYGNSTVAISSSEPYEGTQSAKIYQSSGATKLSYFTTPLFKPSSDAYTLSFWAVVSSATAELNVGTIIDPEDFSTYQSANTLTVTDTYQKFEVSGLTLDQAKAFLIGNQTASKTVYIDSLVVKQNGTTVDFNPAEGEELHVVNPDLFITFSKPIMLSDESEITSENISEIVQLRKETIDGDIIELNYIISENKQTIKASPVQALNGTSYHLVLNDGFKDTDGESVSTSSVHFTVEDFFAPEFIESYPMVENIAETTFDIKVQANENANVYYTVLSEGATAPSAMEIKTGVSNNVAEGNKQVVANSNEIINVTGLERKVNYDLYLTLEDNAGNLQSTVTKIDVSTLDLTAPEFIEDYPVVENLSYNSLDIKLQVNEPGIAYYIIVAEGSSTPTTGQVKLGADYNGVSIVLSNSNSVIANTDLIFSADNLESETSYDIYTVVEDADGNIQANPTKLDITTKDITSPEFVSGYPIIENIKETTLDIKLQINESGKAYYVVLEDGMTAPSAVEVKGGIDYTTALDAGNASVEVGTDLIFNVTNLESDVTYDIYVVAEDSEQNLQEAPVKFNAT